jgi:SAM-dependent methyltransferase
MSREEQEKWDHRYRIGDYVPRTDPSPFLLEALRYVPPGRALVLACGAGRNALALAEAGFEVWAVDISDAAIGMARDAAERRGLDLHFRVADLDEMGLDDPSLGGGQFDLITAFRFMNRPLWPRIVEALAPGGWLVMEMHLQADHDVAGPPPGPMRVEPGELEQAFGDLQIVWYLETVEASDRSERVSAFARLVATKPAGD